MVFLVSVLLLVWQDSVRLDFPEQMDLKALVDSVAATLHWNIIYEEENLANKKVGLHVSGPVSRHDLPDLLRSALRARGLALIPIEPSGWYRILAAEKLAGEGDSGAATLAPLEASAILESLADAGASELRTVAVKVERGDFERVKTAITPLLSKPGGALVSIADTRTLIVTDFVRVLRRIAQLISLLDIDGAGQLVETIPVAHQDPTEIAQIVLRLIADSEKREPGVAGVPLLLQPNPSGGGLIARGTAEQLRQARQWIEQLDVSVERKTELYHPRYVTASRLKSLSESWFGPIMKLIADDPANLLIVTARPVDHARLKEFLAQIDKLADAATTPLRFYKLQNRRADDVFATLATLLGGGSETGGSGSSAQRNSRRESSGGSRSGGSGGASYGVQGGGITNSNVRVPNEAAAPGSQVASTPAVEGTLAGDKAVGTGFQTAELSLAVDEHTNSIIAIAKPELHQRIEALIKELDKRRPQVLVEVTLVSISADDGLDLGVELENLDLDRQWSHLLFTAFGLSALNPATGARQIQVLQGGNGVLIGPDEVPIVFHALATNGNTHVYSAPRILVDDNASGKIESVAESPYTSVNASTTVATTSFAGFAKAGTQLSIEPHIAEGDHLEIDYTLTVSSFTGAGSGGAPPPRSSNTITSTVRVPDGSAVIVGGLLTETVADSVSQIPWLGDVPVVGLLFGQRTHSKSKVRLYAFIKPTVLRDEGFEDLKFFSQESLKEAQVTDGYPPQRFQYMR